MIARIWKAKFDPSEGDRLRQFAAEKSLGYLRSQCGNLGVLYLARGDTWQTITFWRCEDDFRTMERRSDYKELASEIETSGAIREVIAVDVFEVFEPDLSTSVPGQA